MKKLVYNFMVVYFLTSKSLKQSCSTQKRKNIWLLSLINITYTQQDKRATINEFDYQTTFWVWMCFSRISCFFFLTSCWSFSASWWRTTEPEFTNTAKTSIKKQATNKLHFPAQLYKPVFFSGHLQCWPESQMAPPSGQLSVQLGYKQS